MWMACLLGIMYRLDFTSIIMRTSICTTISFNAGSILTEGLVWNHIRGVKMLFWRYGLFDQHGKRIWAFTFVCVCVCTLCNLHVELLTLCPVRTRFQSSPPRGQAELQVLVFDPLLVLSKRGVKITIDTDTYVYKPLMSNLENSVIAGWNQPACNLFPFVWQKRFALY